MQQLETSLANLQMAVRNMLERRNQPGLLPGRKRDRRRFLREHRGLLSAVARRHRVRVSHVCRVFHGEVRSARVKAAILAEIARRQEAGLEPLAHAS